jgi:hypothetical protein
MIIAVIRIAMFSKNGLDTIINRSKLKLVKVLIYDRMPDWRI